jgi:23S rRNA pseudouridine2605 synthase
MSSPSDHRIKLQKFLADLDLGSRREIETWITAGRIVVNDELAHLGQRVSNDDKILVDGKPIQESNQEITLEQTEVIIYHKPIGKVCTRSDEKHRKTVFEDLPKPKLGRWVMVGRLDLNTAGLLLFTNNGQLAHKLMHPSSEIEREYAVRIFGDVDDEALQRLRSGVMLEDGMAKFVSIKATGGDHRNRWFHVVLKRGKNREVRRLWNSQGIEVSRLIRVRFGTIFLPKNLVPGEVQNLSKQQIKKLVSDLGVAI